MNNRATRLSKRILNTLGGVPRKEPVQAALLLVAVLTIFFRDVALGDASLGSATYVQGTMPTGPYGYSGRRVLDLPVRDPGAAAWMTEPWDQLIARTYKSSQIPLWNPHQATGAPLAANMQSAPFFPLSVPIYLVSDQYRPYARDLCLLCQLFAAGFFTFLFARRVGLGRVGALGAASAFMFCGYLVFYLGLVHQHAEVLIPALLYTFERVLSDKKLSSILLAAATVCLSILGGIPEAFFFSFLLAGLYYVYRVVEEAKHRRFDRLFISGSLGRIAVVAVLGCLLSSFCLLPFIEYLPLSYHLHGEMGLAHYAPSTAVTILVPYFLGGAYASWHPPYHTGWTMPYVGVLPVALALLGLCTHRKRPRLAPFFAGFSLFVLLKAYGAPLVGWVGRLPGFNVSLFPKYCAPELAFSVAILAGLGLDHARDGKASVRQALAVGSLLLSVLGGFVLLHRSAIIEYDRVGHVYTHVGLAVVFVLLFCAVLLMSRLGQRLAVCGRKVAAPAGSLVWPSAALLALTVIELFAYLPKERGQRYDPFIPAPYLGFLRADSEKYRVLGLDLVLFPNAASAYQIDCLGSVDGMHIDRYSDFIRRFICPDCADRLTGQGERLYDSAFVDLLNVEYLLTAYPLCGRWRTSGVMTSALLANCQATVAGERPVSAEGIWTIQQDSRSVLRQDAPSRLNCPLAVPKALAMLRFSVGMDPAVWQTGIAEGDGVLFEVYVAGSSGESRLFSKYIDPKSNPADRKWHDAYVDLSPYQGQDLVVTFVTSPGFQHDSRQDWAGWGDVSLIEAGAQMEPIPEWMWSQWLPLSGRLESCEDKWDLVYDREIKVYRNRYALPRAFVVHDVQVVTDEAAILNAMDTPTFEPRTTVLLEEEPPTTIAEALHTAPLRDGSTARVVEYEPGHVTVQASLENPGFLLLGDTYYPGWKASVDGEATKIYTADYLFRAVYVEEGKHTVEFLYDPLSFRVGLCLSIAAVLGTLVYAMVVKARHARPMPRG